MECNSCSSLREGGFCRREPRETFTVTGTQFCNECGSEVDETFIEQLEYEAEQELRNEPSVAALESYVERAA